nr:CSP1 [Frankliniella occidentalis]
MVRAGPLACLALSVLVLAEAVDKYEEGRFAHINVDEVLGNQRILGSFIKCFLDEGPCTADSRDMKKLLPEVIDSKCERCTDNQKKMMAKAVKHVKDNRPDDWERLTNKYDPDHTKTEDIDKFISDALAM